MKISKVEEAYEGLTETSAIELWDKIEGFASYSFNKSHSCAYSILSYVNMWLKVYYPVEFYAASLTYADDKKVRSIINEAKKNGISVLPPSINKSTDKFNPTDDSTIVAPLSKIKFVATAAAHIMHERQVNGPYKSLDDLTDRTLKRLVNTRVIRGMLAVGALDEICPPTLPVDPTERSKALNEYLPSIPLGHVHIPRKMAPTNADKDKLMELFGKLATEDDRYVSPFCGKNMQFMVVTDNATGTEAKNGVFTESKGFNSVAVALYKAGLNRIDGYWTGLVKRQKDKKEKIFSNTVLENSFEILKQEIEILKPTVILCLGTQVARMFDPTLKGGAMDNTGKVIYNSDLDANIVIGFNPAQLFFNPDYAESLDELFEIVGSML